MPTRKSHLAFIFLLFALVLTGCITEPIRPDRPNPWLDGIGTGEPGIDDGPFNKAQFYAPCGIAVDGQDNIYVTEQPLGSVGLVRKITPEGAVSTFAGSRVLDGFNFYRDGPSSSALFFGTFGVVADNSSNVYVTDASNNRMRKIAGGQVSTVKYDPAIAPYGVAMDVQGNLYATDLINNRIIKINSDGTAKVLAGTFLSGFADGAASTARFNGPYGLAVDGQGNVYVADEENEAIRKITPAGLVSTIAGNGVAGMVDGPVNVAQFNSPTGVAVDEQGNVYVADRGNNRVRKISTAGIVSTMTGNGNSALFNNPTGLAIDKKGQYLYITDNRNYKIRRIKL